MSAENISTCPACDSANFSTTFLKKNVSLNESLNFSYLMTVNTCQVCETSGDFTGADPVAYDVAYKIAVSEFISSVFDKLKDEGVTMAYFEKALGLPARSLARWKRGETTAGHLALLKLVSLFPWLLEVGEKNFNKQKAEQIARNYFVQKYPRYSWPRENVLHDSSTLEATPLFRTKILNKDESSSVRHIQIRSSFQTHSLANAYRSSNAETILFEDNLP